MMQCLQTRFYWVRGMSAKGNIFHIYNGIASLLVSVSVVTDEDVDMHTRDTDGDDKKEHVKCDAVCGM